MLCNAMGVGGVSFPGKASRRCKDHIVGGVKFSG